jgi:hypothetical protein
LACSSRLCAADTNAPSISPCSKARKIWTELPTGRIVISSCRGSSLS